MVVRTYTTRLWAIWPRFGGPSGGSGPRFSIWFSGTRSLDAEAVALDGRDHIGQPRACVQVLASGHGRVGGVVSDGEMSCGSDAVAVLAVLRALGGRWRGLTEGKLLTGVFPSHGCDIHGRR
jgi:hypothetical protein